MSYSECSHDVEDDGESMQQSEVTNEQCGDVHGDESCTLPRDHEGYHFDETQKTNLYGWIRLEPKPDAEAKSASEEMPQRLALAHSHGMPCPVCTGWHGVAFDDPDCPAQPKPDATGWMPIATAPMDGTVIWCYTESLHGLPAFESPCAWHPDAGFCTDELRMVTKWKPLVAQSKPDSKCVGRYGMLGLPCEIVKGHPGPCGPCVQPKPDAAGEAKEEQFIHEACVRAHIRFPSKPYSLLTEALAHHALSAPRNSALEEALQSYEHMKSIVQTTSEQLSNLRESHRNLEDAAKEMGKALEDEGSFYARMDLVHQSQHHRCLCADCRKNRREAALARFRALGGE